MSGLGRMGWILLIGVGLIGAALFAKKFYPKGPAKAIAVEGGRSLNVKIETEPFLQQDARWRDDQLGMSGGSLGNFGCTVCATAMALSSQGFSIDPKALNTKLTEQGSFTSSGLLIWAGIGELTDDAFRVQIVDRPSHAYLDRQLEKKNPLIAKVLYEGQIWHWVLITGKSGKQYLMHDPLGHHAGHEPMSRYKHGIFAVRHLK